MMQIQIERIMMFRIREIINRSSTKSWAASIAWKLPSSQSYLKLGLRMGCRCQLRDPVSKCMVAWLSAKAGATREKEASQVIGAFHWLKLRRSGSTRLASSVESKPRDSGGIQLEERMPAHSAPIMV